MVIQRRICEQVFQEFVYEKEAGARFFENEYSDNAIIRRTSQA